MFSPCVNTPLSGGSSPSHSLSPPSHPTTSRWPMEARCRSGVFSIVLHLSFWDRVHHWTWNSSIQPDYLAREPWSPSRLCLQGVGTASASIQTFLWGGGSMCCRLSSPRNRTQQLFYQEAVCYAGRLLEDSYPKARAKDATGWTFVVVALFFLSFWLFVSCACCIHFDWMLWLLSSKARMRIQSAEGGCRGERCGQLSWLPKVLTSTTVHSLRHWPAHMDVSCLYFPCLTPRVPLSPYHTHVKMSLTELSPSPAFCVFYKYTCHWYVAQDELILRLLTYLQRLLFQEKSSSQFQ